MAGRLPAPVVGLFKIGPSAVVRTVVRNHAGRQMPLTNRQVPVTNRRMPAAGTRFGRALIRALVLLRRFRVLSRLAYQKAKVVARSNPNVVVLVAVVGADEASSSRANKYRGRSKGRDKDKGRDQSKDRIARAIRSICRVILRSGRNNIGKINASRNRTGRTNTARNRIGKGRGDRINVGKNPIAVNTSNPSEVSILAINIREININHRLVSRSRASKSSLVSPIRSRLIRVRSSHGRSEMDGRSEASKGKGTSVPINGADKNKGADKINGKSPPSMSPLWMKR